MKVYQLVAELLLRKQDADIFVARPNHDGCGTCGYGETSSECDIRLVDLDSKIIIEGD